MLGCLDSPTSGDYFLDGVNVAGMTDDELSDIRNQQIGFIFQGFNLIPSLTAQENVELPLIYRGNPQGGAGSPLPGGPGPGGHGRTHDPQTQ